MDILKDSFKVPTRPLTAMTVYNTGVQYCAPGYRWGPGVRDHYLIHAVLEGCGTYTTRGTTHALRTGDLFLARPDETISYTADEEMPWHYAWVGFHGPDAAPLLAQTDFAKNRPFLHLEDDPEARDLLLAIYHARGGHPHETARMTGKLYEFLAHLMQTSRQQDAGKTAPSLTHVRRACAYIAGNFASPISIEDIAKSADVSRSLLYRAFETELGLSPAAYLARFRMREACLLLEKGDLSVKAVAYSVGFEDPLYFSRRFKELMGTNPASYAESQAPTHPDVPEA